MWVMEVKWCRREKGEVMRVKGARPMEVLKAVTLMSCDYEGITKQAAPP